MTSNIQTLQVRYVFSSMLICLLMMTALLWMPALLGALAQGYGLGPGALSRLASFELLGFLAGILVTSGKSIQELKLWLCIAVAALVLVNITLILVAPGIPFVVLRPLAGIASGIGLGYSFKICALSAHPTRSFGILTGLMSTTMIIGFQGIALLTAWLTSGGEVDIAEQVKKVVNSVFALYALFPILGLLLYLFNQPPTIAPVPGAEGLAEKSGGGLSMLVLLGLFSIIISFTGQGGVWAFLQTLGVSHGFSVTGVANAMSTFAIVGIIGSFSAAALPQNIPRWVTIGSALLFLWIGLYALYTPRNLGWYVFGCAAGGFYWNFALPQQLGLLAKIDASGRGSVLGGSMSSAGSAIGPLLAGLLISGTNYQPVGWMVALFCFIGFVCIWMIEGICRRSANTQGVL